MDSIQVESTDLKKQAAIYGVILGVISFVLAIITLIIGANASGIMTVSFVSILLVYVVPLVITCLLAVRLRRMVGGYWDFRTALSHIFIMLAVSVVLSTVGSKIVSRVMPSLEERAIDNMMNNSIESLESMGFPDEQIDATVEQLELQKEGLYTFSFVNLVQALAVSLIMYFILALILAAIFKKEKPIFIDVPADNAHPWQDPQEPKN
ncbi:DUF4199 domain-containing protein [Sphingobacterium sp. lm-10]|uniref:DUF4199 domain-containing protein n=1 Tax=Sphingobacterium sp. lm-10 TaxID=2944904 RepID=UPI0020221BBB|nr:DUF4199 domain-containing protein [Sphingobacterium sp. lm-10]MCL7987374.1 DUF4199 domain-containing protein [Sphingobacterium sp. lm-10]